MDFDFLPCIEKHPQNGHLLKLTNPHNVILSGLPRSDLKAYLSYLRDNGLSLSQKMDIIDTLLTTYTTDDMKTIPARASLSSYHSFTGKELDEETGYSYFGARYYDPAVLAAWLSVDPMSDKYPSISPYAYCAWNPLRLVDPAGKDI